MKSQLSMITTSVHARNTFFLQKRNVSFDPASRGSDTSWLETQFTELHNSSKTAHARTQHGQVGHPSRSDLRQRWGRRQEQPWSKNKKHKERRELLRQKCHQVWQLYEHSKYWNTNQIQLLRKTWKILTWLEIRSWLSKAWLKSTKLERVRACVRECVSDHEKNTRRNSTYCPDRAHRGSIMSKLPRLLTSPLTPSSLHSAPGASSGSSCCFLTKQESQKPGEYLQGVKKTTSGFTEFCAKNARSLSRVITNPKFCKSLRFSGTHFRSLKRLRQRPTSAIKMAARKAGAATKIRASLAIVFPISLPHT